MHSETKLEYQIAPEEFSAQVAAALLSSGAFEKTGGVLYCFDSVSSTMDLARALYSSKANELKSAAVSLGAVPFEKGPLEKSGPTAIVLSRSQTEGRGRNRRGWYSEHDAGVYVTYILSPDVPPRQLVGYSLACGLGVKRALDKFGALVELKWPNDIVVRSGGENGFLKLGGILVDLLTTGDSVGGLMVGIGLNLNRITFPPTVPGISLEELIQQKPDYFVVFAELTAELLRVSELYFATGFLPLREEWERSSILTGRDIRCLAPNGEIRGRVRGVDSDGGLMVITEGGREQVIYSGDLE